MKQRASERNRLKCNVQMYTKVHSSATWMLDRATSFLVAIKVLFCLFSSLARNSERIHK